MGTHQGITMSRYTNWSSQQPPIWEVPDDELISADSLKNSIVLSMKADDDDWTNYRRRSSGGSAVAMFHQSRSRSSSRRTSRDDSQISQTEDLDSVNEAPAPFHSDISCDDLLAYVKLKLDSVMAEDKENSSSVRDVDTKLHRQRRHGQASVIRRPPVQTLSLANGSRFNQPTNVSPKSPVENLDITGQTSEMRYPWLRDVSTQCDIVEPPEGLNVGSGSQPGLLIPNPRSPFMPRTKRSQSSSSIYANNEATPSVVLTRPPSAPHTVTELEGKVILQPDVLEHTYEFFSEQAAQRNDRDGSGDEAEIHYDRSKRRACIVSTLDLGEALEPVEDEKDSKHTYPGDLLLYNGQSLRQGSPPTNTIQGSKLNHYGSEGSLIDTNSSCSNSSNGYTIASQEKSKPLKTTKSFLKMLRSKRYETPTVESFLNQLKPSEFKDDKLSSLRHQHWREVLKAKGELLDEITHAESARRDAVWEIFTNECVFLVDHLMVLKHVFLEPLKKCQVEDLLMEVDPSHLFGNLDTLIHLSLSFCRDFVTEMKSMDASNFGNTVALCDCLDKMTSNSREGDIYHTYVLNYRSAITYLDCLRETSEEFSIFERLCERDPKCNKLGLKDILVAPMQHWTRLPLILKRIRNKTERAEDIQRLDECVDNVTSSLNVLDNKIEWQKTFERVKEIQDQLIWPTLLEIDSKAFVPESLRGLVNISPRDSLLADQLREVAYEGPLIFTEKDNKTDVYVFLFSDILLVTKIKNHKKTRGRISTVDKNEGFYHVLRQPIPVDTLLVHDIGQTEASASGMKNMFVVIQRNPYQQVTALYTFQAHTLLGKQKWLLSLRDCKDKLVEVNNNNNGVCRHESFKRVMHLEDHPILLKNSQVLPLTTSTSPRSPKPGYTGSLGRERQHTNLYPIIDNPEESNQRYLNKSRTMSAGCLGPELTTLQRNFRSVNEFIH